MPTYEYRCPDGHEFEHFYRTISAASAELKCPHCGKMAQRKMSGGAALLFKGSGFYITDYGKDGKKDQRARAPEGEGSSAKEKAEKPSGESAAGSGGEKKTESKGPAKDE
jgi:putative FmdB family regulatory protein